jgi:hypothetical protein
MMDEDEGLVVELDEPPPEVEMLEDGGAIVSIEGEEEVEPGLPTEDFYTNLAPHLEQGVLDSLALELMQKVDEDKEARKQRDKDYAEATKRTGLGKEAPGGADFDGASRAVHPMLFEACVDFASRAIRELMPPNGPVKIHIPGDHTDPERLKKAERKKNYMNWQCIFQMPELRTELEQLLSQLPLGGAMYLRLTPDFASRRRRPVPLFVPLDFVTIPASASSYYTAERQCYWEHITSDEYAARVEEEMYLDVALMPVGMPTETEAEKAAQKVEGVQPDPNNQDGLRIVCEVSVERDIGEGLLPYLISVDHGHNKVLSIVRNWEQEDETQERMQWMVEWLFFAWRGAQGVGLGQAIGSLAGAATGVLRALLDSGHIQNIPTLARLKGANFSGQSRTLNATQIVDVEGGVAGDSDIRKFLMPIPFNGPSQTLFELLGFLTDTGRQAIHIALDKLSENNKNLPVGTTLALIEEGMKVMSAIHLRMFHSMSYFIRILHRIDRMYLKEEDLRDDIGEVLAHKSDFEGPLDCIPTADPEIFSDVQRIAQAQILADRAAALPQIYQLRETEKFLLERAKIPNPERFLVPAPKPEEMNQVNENVAMTLGRPVTAFPEQDHLAHLQVLVEFMLSPVLGQLPIIAPSFLPAALAHMKEHLVLWYANEYYGAMRGAMGATDDDMTLVMRERDPETRQKLDRTLAAASVPVGTRATRIFKDLPAIVAQAQEIISQFQPASLPTDPNKMALVQQKREAEQIKDRRERERMASERESKIIELNARREEKAQDAAVDFAKLSASEREVAFSEAQENARQARELAAQLEQLVLQDRADAERAAADRESEERRNTQDNETAVRIAAAEIKSSEQVGVSTGTGTDQNPSGGRRR